ncbi:MULTISPECIES: LysM peptidoglycan-binding domain-containing protein [unclassified Tolypothrix]|uniref:LysM peptidoglycan-binding domain-containing protein n=1 Tax=unclassified Tolypothrix TaxID=2649714 RepID=UPI0005F80936|nr:MULTISPECIES: LysM domain-containing protein [unclassified Tolypothrix]MBE9083907.1 LysM peptidoglycan-binding domain-containing protein [Tolypothrix sp. LEGE 11397]UYD30974.1 LysM peptidoglycan-binding domain-containing protein [Tolypothrix sp. PCC 7712]UYD38858.1 LysM peptidoglycan-binding domain-containing protein [Tolypothrix sp. PCC 7601]BAY95891.1 hypothetical protein NIES3275_79680 [Microchaete diplosiphon NIES-3275]
MAKKQNEGLPTTHKVEPGDIFSDIAQAYYGNGNYQKIIDANGGIDPKLLQVGTILTIPA